MSVPEKKKFVQSPVLPEECPACHTDFQFAEQRIVQQLEDKVLFHGYCGKCYTRLLVFQFERDKTVLSAIALLTDLTYTDACAYWASRRITHDDVLKMYAVLQDGTRFQEQICGIPSKRN